MQCRTPKAVPPGGRFDRHRADPAEDEIGAVEVAGASYANIFPTPFNGTTVAPSGSKPGFEIQLSAEVQAAPLLAGVAPSTGTVKGGTEVAISGLSFNGASAVEFGGVPATSFSVDSDTRITAVAPKAAKPGERCKAGKVRRVTGAARKASRAIKPSAPGRQEPQGPMGRFVHL